MPTAQPVEAVTLAAILQNPYARDVAHRAGYVPGDVLDVDDLQAAMALLGYYLTEDDARAAAVHGPNLRCNRCGTYGATWTDNGVRSERPGWGALALCASHKQELADEHKRHAAELSRLRQVNFEQPLPKPTRYCRYEDY